MNLFISPCGELRCLYGEAVNLHDIGTPHIQRASHVEPDSNGNWNADLSPVKGPQLGPFETRTQAIDAEITWLEENVLTPPR
jgi:hypothetical protein